MTHAASRKYRPERRRNTSLGPEIEYRIGDRSVFALRLRYRARWLPRVARGRSASDDSGSPKAVVEDWQIVWLLSACSPSCSPDGVFQRGFLAVTICDMGLSCEDFAPET
jgi:hypothetical protein